MSGIEGKELLWLRKRAHMNTPTQNGEFKNEKNLYRSQNRGPHCFYGKVVDKIDIMNSQSLDF